MRKVYLNTLIVALTLISVTSCSNPSSMAKEANLITVSSTPAVLEVVADEINVNYTISFPEGYFNSKALLEVTPVLVYSNGEAVAPFFFLQGDKVTDNHRVVGKAGGKISNKTKFAYKPGMEKSHLELRLTVWNKTKKYPFPQAIKVADGAITTYKLLHDEGEVENAKHQYKLVLTEKKEAQILYKINDSKVNTKELTKQEIKEFESFLSQIEKDGKRSIKSTDIVAYASPDGDSDKNSKLSQERGQSAKDAFGKITKKTQVNAPVNVSTIAEDWEGFKELVAGSNIPDKELILRVLSMYNDPLIREREIRNMSQVFKTLADKILPELRRARFIANIDFSNYTNEELKELANSNIDLLDNEALLYVGSIVKDKETKILAYKTSAEKFGCPRAMINLANTYINANQLEEAKAVLAKSPQKGDLWYNSMGVIALREKKYKEAEDLFAQSKLKIAKDNSAILDLMFGRYTIAAAKLDGTGEANESLAYILTNNLDKALTAINNNHTCPHSAYIRAIIAARKGNAAEVKTQLEKASKRKDLAVRMKTDIEFAKYR